MQSFLLATGLVTLAEIGDKTQLLAFLLAARYRRPLPIILGILVATLANHALAAGLGTYLVTLFAPTTLGYVLALCFGLMAIWVLIPDKISEDERPHSSRWGVFATALGVFFLAEMGDKTQIATVALGARLPDYWSVVMGTTMGMMIANVPPVLASQKLLRKIPVRMVHIVAAALFAIMAVTALIHT